MPCSFIRLIGPGGAGKSTAGLALAQRLGWEFQDLDEIFLSKIGAISAYIANQGYEAYADRNVQLYLDLMATPARPAVLALSSGFMTYSSAVHPDYSRCKDEITMSCCTFVLLPSLDREICIAETVRRQLLRPFTGSASRETQVIASRFKLYFNLPVQKIETKRPVHEVVEAIASLIR